jgi:branched-chain amino acid transport system substrate-binding protein
MQRYQKAIAGVAAAAAVALCGCTSPAPIVGVLQPLTGAAAIYGKSIDDGMQLAYAEAEQNNMLPPEFRLVKADTGSIPSIAVSEYRRLVKEDAVRLVMGGVTTDEAYALIPEVEEARVICLSPSVSATDISKKSKYFYRLFPTDETEGMTAADHLMKRSKRRLMIYTDDSLYTRGIESEFRQHYQLKQTGRIMDTVHLRSPEWRARSTDLLYAHNPQAVYIIGHAERILEVLGHLDKVGYDGVRCTTSTFFVTDVISQAGKLANEVIFPLTSYDGITNINEEQEKQRSFSEQYEEVYGHKPDIFAAHGFDAMRIAIRAFNNADSFYPSGIKKALAFNLEDLTGATGALSFDDHGDIKHYPVMHIYAYDQVMTWEEYKRRRLEGVSF